MAIQKITAKIIADGAIIAADVADGSITNAKIDSVANTKITGLITSAQIANVANTQVTGNPLFSAGSNTAPAITTSGDTNTGIFFPTADTIAFTEGGAEAMRIDSSGKVGIGATNPLQLLHLSSASSPLIQITYQTVGASQIGVVSGNALTFGLDTSNGSTERMRITSDGLLQFDSGYGSVVTAYGCRAWVNFNGTGTVAIRGSGNVSSITDNGVGDYTVNFTTAMPDANYAFTGTAKPTSAQTNETLGRIVSGKYNVSPTTSALRVVSCTTATGLEDFDIVNVSVFR